MLNVISGHGTDVEERGNEHKDAESDDDDDGCRER